MKNLLIIAAVTLVGVVGYFAFKQKDQGPVQENVAVSRGAPGVKKTGTSSFEIEQSEFDRVIGNREEMATEARVVPALEGEKPAGFKIVNIKPGSFFENIGLVNGDVVMKINGESLDSADKVEEFFHKYKTAKQFNIDVKRSDKDLRFEI